MKLIIEIPDNVFKRLVAGEVHYGGITARNIFNSVKEGTPYEERPQGEWIEMTDNYGHSSYFCSRCGAQEGKPYGVCPNCKAKMKGVKKIAYSIVN